jgi:hypothetical protein
MRLSGTASRPRVSSLPEVGKIGERRGRRRDPMNLSAPLSLDCQSVSRRSQWRDYSQINIETLILVAIVVTRRRLEFSDR